MALADKWGKPLYEVMPDKFPQGRLASLELKLWTLFHNEKRKK